MAASKSEVTTSAYKQDRNIISTTNFNPGFRVQGSGFSYQMSKLQSNRKSYVEDGVLPNRNTYISASRPDRFEISKIIAMFRYLANNWTSENAEQAHRKLY